MASNKFIPAKLAQKQKRIKAFLKATFLAKAKVEAGSNKSWAQVNAVGVVRVKPSAVPVTLP